VAWTSAWVMSGVVPPNSETPRLNATERPGADLGGEQCGQGGRYGALEAQQHQPDQQAAGELRGDQRCSPIPVQARRRPRPLCAIFTAPRMTAACHFDAWRGGGGDASMVSATALADSVSTRAAG
jgi:hypothetical protein